MILKIDFKAHTLTTCFSVSLSLNLFTVAHLSLSSLPFVVVRLLMWLLMYRGKLCGWKEVPSSFLTASKINQRLSAAQALTLALYLTRTRTQTRTPSLVLFLTLVPTGKKRFPRRDFAFVDACLNVVCSSFCFLLLWLFCCPSTSWQLRPIFYLFILYFHTLHLLNRKGILYSLQCKGEKKIGR